MDKKQLIVTAAIIEDKGKFLITQRPTTTSNGGRWEFPGGKLEFGEDLRECLEREIKEELGIKIKADDPFEFSTHQYLESTQIILLAFHCTFISGKIEKHNIADFTWVLPEEMKEYDITEADLPFVKKLLS